MGRLDVKFLEFSSRRARHFSRLRRRRFLKQSLSHSRRRRPSCPYESIINDRATFQSNARTVQRTLRELPFYTSSAKRTESRAPSSRLSNISGIVRKARRFGIRDFTSTRYGKSTAEVVPATYFNDARITIYFRKYSVHFFSFDRQSRSSL